MVAGTSAREPPEEVVSSSVQGAHGTLQGAPTGEVQDFRAVQRYVLVSEHHHQNEDQQRLQVQPIQQLQQCQQQQHPPEQSLQEKLGSPHELYLQQLSQRCQPHEHATQQPLRFPGSYLDYVQLAQLQQQNEAGNGPQRKRRPDERRRCSPVWHLFNDAGEDTCICKECGAKVPYKNSNPTNMRKHGEIHHKAKWAEILAQYGNPPRPSKGAMASGFMRRAVTGGSPGEMQEGQLSSLSEQNETEMHAPLQGKEETGSEAPAVVSTGREGEVEAEVPVQEQEPHLDPKSQVMKYMPEWAAEAVKAAACHWAPLPKPKRAKRMLEGGLEGEGEHERKPGGYDPDVKGPGCQGEGGAPRVAEWAAGAAGGEKPLADAQSPDQETSSAEETEPAVETALAGHVRTPVAHSPRKREQAQDTERESEGDGQRISTCTT